ncbi:MAG: ABC transporter permease [Solirubrobacterales bacterium]
MKALRWTVVNVVPPLAILILIGVGWQVYIDASGISPVILPSPGEVAEALADNRSLLLSDLWVTGKEIIYGLFIGVAAGMLLGMLIAGSKAFERSLYPLVIASQAVPVFALAPLLVIWFGFGTMPKVLMAAVIVFFPICVNQVVGLRSADPGAIDVMRSYGAGEVRIFRSVRFPSSIPYLLAGTQLGATYAVIGAVIAEWLGANKGLGYRMVAANAAANTDLVFAAIFVTALAGIVLFVLVRVIGNLLFPWQAKSGHAT